MKVLTTESWSSRSPNKKAMKIEAQEQEKTCDFLLTSVNNFIFLTSYNYKLIGTHELPISIKYPPPASVECFSSSSAVGEEWFGQMSAVDFEDEQFGMRTQLPVTLSVLNCSTGGGRRRASLVLYLSMRCNRSSLNLEELYEQNYIQNENQMTKCHSDLLNYRDERSIWEKNVHRDRTFFARRTCRFNNSCVGKSSMDSSSWEAETQVKLCPKVLEEQPFG